MITCNRMYCKGYVGAQIRENEPYDLDEKKDTDDGHQTLWISPRMV